MTATDPTLLVELKALRATHQKHYEELQDPSLTLFHERNGGYEETTAPFLTLAQSTLACLDRLIAAVETKSGTTTKSG
jgi:hypothetical protein